MNTDSRIGSIENSGLEISSSNISSLQRSFNDSFNNSCKGSRLCEIIPIIVFKANFTAQFKDIFLLEQLPNEWRLYQIT